MRFTWLLCGIVVVATACGSSSGDSSSVDGTGAGDDGGGMPSKEAGTDGAGTPDAPSDAPAPDSGKDGGGDAGDPMSPHPPPGATACGTGTFTGADALAACNSGWSSFGTFAKNGCGALTTTGGDYQAWCTDKATYFYARFHSVALPAAFDGCPIWALFPLGSAGSGGGTIGNDGPNGYATDPPNTTFSTSGPAADVAIWMTAGPKLTGATLYIASTQFGACTAPSGDYAMLGAPIVVK